jgi:hypothetical protein
VIFAVSLARTLRTALNNMDETQNPGGAAL